LWSEVQPESDFKLMRCHVVFAAVVVTAALGCSSETPSSPSGPAGNAGTAPGGSGNSAGAAAVGGAGAPNQGGATELGGADPGGGNATGGNATGGNAAGGDAATGGGSAGGAAPAGHALSDCALKFPYQDEPERGTWLGGDSAYSTLLSPTLALWSFQDTFIGKHGQTARQGAAIIANSFALLSCDNGVQSIKFFWGQNGAIFSDGVADQRFWPQQPIIYQGFLFAAMTRVQGGANEIGTTLARVSNPFDPPDQWHAEYFELAALSGLGKGTVVVGKYAYLFGNAGQAVITRLPLDELIKPDAVPAALLEYLASDGQWKPGLDTAAAKKLGFSANVGTSFRYLKNAQKWLVLFTNTSGWPSATISVSTAPNLEGPWSKPVNVFEVPEMTVGKPEYDKDNVCYAGIEHDESNPDSATDLLFSYTCNSFVFEKQLANMAIYLPEIVKLKNPVAN
jgi:hypothetical protein